jgi:hypothetical protein
VRDAASPQSLARELRSHKPVVADHAKRGQIDEARNRATAIRLEPPPSRAYTATLDNKEGEEMKSFKWRAASLLIAATALVTSLAAAAPRTDAADGECEPVCYKHPITGEIICTPPCP